MNTLQSYIEENREALDAMIVYLAQSEPLNDHERELWIRHSPRLRDYVQRDMGRELVWVSK